MQTKIDIESWPRKTYYAHFSKMDDPFYGLVFQVDVTKAYSVAKSRQVSFFLFYHYLAMQAITNIPEFHYRIIDSDIYLFDSLDIGTTMLRDDDSFSFLFLPYNSDFHRFEKQAMIEQEAVRQTSGIGSSERTAQPDLIYFSTIPWISFTDLSHAHNFDPGFGVPRITFGKFYKQDKALLMPVSVHVHHGFVDGLHVGKFATYFQQVLNNSESYLIR